MDGTGRPPPYLSLKLDPQRVPDLPAPRPKYEIWVYSPRVEGVHLRFGAVARGGLRWSDRREDFRTEMLGLVKAQAVKNAVIVPVGAKGGFVVKGRPADPGDREAVLAEGIACYRTFVSALLDVTDNLVERRRRAAAAGGAPRRRRPLPRRGRRQGHRDVLRHRQRGLASYGFWLGDAFASGGSAGYDHKAMGITARGAWESVKRHFRELGVDTQTAGLHRGRRRRHVRRRVRQRDAAVRAHPAAWPRSTTGTSSSTPTRTRRCRTRSGAGCSTCPRSSWADYDRR